MSINHAQVAHRWAQNKGDNCRGPNMFCRGDRIYSYGEHFPIARHVGDVVLMTTQHRSSTTTGHVTLVRRALSFSHTVFVVPDVMASTKEDHRRNVADYEKRIQTEIACAQKARVWKQAKLNIATGIAEARIAYAAHFKLGRIRGGFDPQSEGWIEGLQVKADLKSKATRRQNEIAQKRRARETAAALDDWRNRRREADKWIYLLRSHALRLSANGKQVETTLAAQIPTRHARKAWPSIITLCQQAARENRELSADVRVGTFAITRIMPDGSIVAGCHVIEWSELNHAAGLLGLASAKLQAPA